MESIEKAAVAYIRQARQLGNSDDQIIQTLIAQGVAQADIMAAFLELENSSSDPVVPPPVNVPQQLHQSPPSPRAPREFPIQKLVMVVVIAMIGAAVYGAFTFLPGWFSSLPIAQNGPAATSGPAAFAGYEPIYMNAAVVYQSIEFTVTGSTVVPAASTPDLLFDNIEPDTSVLMVYYTAVNTADEIRGLFENGIVPATAHLYSADTQLIPSDFEFTENSLQELTELLPHQQTSNAILFGIPSSISDAKGLYLALDLGGSSLQKKYLQL